MEGDSRLGVLDGAAGEDVVSSGEPEGQVSTGGVAGGHDVAEVEGVGAGQGAYVVVASGDVLEGMGPAAAGGTYAAVLEGPDGDAVASKCGAEVARVGEVVLGLPPAAVEEDEQGRLALPGRKPEVAELFLAWTVRDAVVGFGRCAADEVHWVSWLLDWTFEGTPPPGYFPARVLQSLGIAWGYFAEVRPGGCGFPVRLRSFSLLPVYRGEGGDCATEEADCASAHLG